MEPGSQPILGQLGTFELLPQNVAGTISRAQTTFRETIGPAQRPAEDCSEFPVPSGPFLNCVRAIAGNHIISHPTAVPFSLIIREPYQLLSSPWWMPTTISEWLMWEEMGGVGRMLLA